MTNYNVPNYKKLWYAICHLPFHLTHRLAMKKIGDAVDKTNNKKYINTEVKMNVMVKKDIHVENKLVEIEVPEDFLGKDVEVIIREKEVKTDKNELEVFFSRFNYDLSNLVFNRDELHER
jgi:hypothetical protein